MSKFKVGDFFRRKGESEIYQVRYIEDDWVSGEAATTLAKHCVACPENEVERVEPKDAFLEELRALMIRHNVKIHIGSNGYDADEEWLCFEVGEQEVCYTHDYRNGFDFPLTADNINDYDKEEV